MNSSPTSNKKAKLVSNEELVAAAWSHYLQFLDSTQDDNPDGDLDELTEILELLLPHVTKPVHCAMPEKFDSRKELLPAMVSVVSNCLADVAIAASLQTKNPNVDHEVLVHVRNALEYCPWNASSWSMTANWARITKRLTAAQVGSWYHHAALLAQQVRSSAITISEDEAVDNSVKEWIELLLLNQIAGVELESTNDEDSEDDDGENDYWSASSVEGTARFMAAMQMSTTGQHAEALEHLQNFDLSHRLHPNVWDGNPTTSSSADAPIVVRTKEPPAIYKMNPSGKFLPANLYDRMCEVFHPESTYWKESDYDSRGYYSFFVDNAPADKNPSNVIDEVIRSHMLPAVQQHIGKEKADKICGFEWWVHTRPIQANLGHNLHFDTDEALLFQEGKITHPVVSSVLYLTGGTNGGGPTIVLDESPESEDSGVTGWRTEPRDNQLLLFPGNLLHGVLPCPGLEKQGQVTVDGLAPSLADLKESKIEDAQRPPNRLTFMVGFWTRRVPDKMKKRTLYGPCGPMPQPTDEHSWVKRIQNGYSSDSPRLASTADELYDRVDGTQVGPVWDTFKPENRVEGNPALTIPKGIDHRFFVKGAPACFRESLFEKDEFDCDDSSHSSDSDPNV